MRHTLAYRSWATEEADARVRPATTARMVAKATAEINASRTDPPRLPGPPPTAWASSGEARLPDDLAIWLVLAGVDQRRGAETEHQRHQVEGADQTDRPEHGLAGGVRGGVV